MGTHYQFRAYIGPAYEPETSAYHYAWAGLWGGTLNPATTETTVATTVADGATSVVLAGAPQTTKGGYWLGPNGTGQGWEYISYSGASGATLTGVRREGTAIREHNGVHTAGASARQWWDVTGDNGRLTLSELLDDPLSAITWTAELSGALAPQAALRRRHLVVVQTKAGAGAWTNALVGFLHQPRIRDDEKRLANWQFQITSVAGVADA